MTSERDQLKQILLPEELELLDELKKRMLDRKAFAESVSEVLTDATRSALKRDNRYQRQLSAPIAKGFDQAIEKNRDNIINAFIPIIGSIIRKSITNSIRKITADFNRAVELGISAKAIKWRIQSIRTGVPFAEIVFNHTIEYEITQLFLIDNETGLLIEYAGREEALMKDKDALSAMLTAIQDFVRDSVAVGESGLSAAELEDNVIWIISGPNAYLAAVIKGTPGARLNEHLSVFTEELHAEYRTVLSDHDLWGHDPALKSDLEKQLITKSMNDDDGDAEKTKSKRWIFWLFIVLLLFAAWFWWRYTKEKETRDMRSALDATPGLVIQKLDRTDTGYAATGLQDPVADVSTFTHVQFNTKPYYSIEDSIIHKRIQQLVNRPDITATVNNGHVVLQGQLLQPLKDETYSRLLNLPGVVSINNQTSALQNFEDFLNINPLPDGLSVSRTDDTVILSGEVLQTTFEPWLEQLQQAGFNNNQDSLSYVTPATELESLINDSFVTMQFVSRFSDDEVEQLHQVFAQALKLNRFYGGYVLLPQSHSDCSGSIAESNENNRLRERALIDFYQQHYTDQIAMQTQLHMCTELNESMNPSQIGIDFKVQKQ